MIGMVTTGKSFYHCINYCLEDKRTLSEQQKLELSNLENVQHKNRAEVLAYNQCFGDIRELTSQFNDVRNLNKRVEKPVFHFALRLSPGETLAKNQLIDVGHACAREFKVDQNQYICILHKDTREQHIHIVANRVGYDGRVASDSNSYLRMANLCRRLEKEYKLKEVLNPKAFLSKEERLLPRHDARKELLKKNIQQTLRQVKTFAEFEYKMKSLGYQVLKGRGISFIDDKKVKIKGSDAGFSLMRIEKILAIKKELESGNVSEKIRQEQSERKLKHVETKNHVTVTQRIMINHNLSAHQEKSMEKSTAPELQKELGELLYELMKPEQIPDNLVPEWLKKKKKKKRSGHSH